VATLSGRQGDIGEYFMDALFSRLPEPVANFLVQTSILERMSVELCEAVTCCGKSAEYLDQLATETPFLAAAEHQHWMRLHPLARDFLLARFEQLADRDARDLPLPRLPLLRALRALPRGACHALAAGDLTATEAHAARSLWTLGTQGRITEARAWLERIPQHVLTDDIELGLIAAWIIASSERNSEALATAQAALHDPDSEPQRRLVAARVAGVAAIYADRLGLVPGHPRRLARWWRMPIRSTWSRRRTAAPILALYAGANSEVRERGARAPAEHSAPSLPFALAFSRTLVALSHLQDGNCYRVESMLRPLLAEAERTGGRRGTAACFFAAVQAAALRELGQPSAALAVLADRLDAIERCGVPEVVLLAYRTLATSRSTRTTSAAPCTCCRTWRPSPPGASCRGWRCTRSPTPRASTRSASRTETAVQLLAGSTAGRVLRRARPAAAAAAGRAWCARSRARRWRWRARTSRACCASSTPPSARRAHRAHGELLTCAPCARCCWPRARPGGDGPARGGRGPGRDRRPAARAAGRAPGGGPPARRDVAAGQPGRFERGRLPSAGTPKIVPAHAGALLTAQGSAHPRAAPRPACRTS
jgi:hypothetical protein